MIPWSLRVIYHPPPPPQGGRNEIFFLYFGEVGYIIFNYFFHYLKMFFWSPRGWNKLFICFIHTISFLIAFIIYSNKPNASPEIWKVGKAFDCNVKVGFGVLKPTLTVFFYLRNLERVFNPSYAFLRSLKLELPWMMVMTFSDNNMTGFGAVWIHGKRGENWHFCKPTECQAWSQELYIYTLFHKVFKASLWRGSYCCYFTDAIGFFSFYFSRYSSRLRQWNKKYFFVLLSLSEMNMFVSLTMKVKPKKLNISYIMLG